MSPDEAALQSRVDALVVNTSAEATALQTQVQALVAKVITLENRSAVLEAQIRCLSEGAQRPQPTAA